MSNIGDMLVDVKGLKSVYDKIKNTFSTKTEVTDVDNKFGEVTSARQSGTGTTYNNLKARLDADKEAAEQDISALKADLGEQLGTEAIRMVANKYIDLSGSTVPMSDGSPAYSGTTPARSCGIISCEPGDDAIISGTGGGQARLWGFVDSSGNILEKANASSTAENLVITAPANTAFLIVHTNNDKISYKGFSKIDSAEKSTVNMLVLEQGSLRLADGVEKENTTRVRTITKVTKPMRIVCPTGIIVTGAFYYNTSDGSFNSTVAYESQIADINIVSGTYARLVFAKADTTTDISVSDMVGLDTITVFYNDIETLKLAEKTNILNVICLEMGGISNTGVYFDSTTRARTVTKFTDNVTMTCPDGIVVFGVFYFNISDDTLSRSAELRTQSATISPASGEYAVVTFSKTNTSQTIALTDIKGIDTMETFNARLNALDDKINESAENLSEILIVEQGSLRLADGLELDSTTKLRTVSKIYNSLRLKLHDGFVIYSAIYFNTDGTYNSYQSIGTQSAKITLPAGTYARLVIAKSDNAQQITVDEFNAINTVNLLNDRIGRLESINVPPMVEFSYDHSLYDCSAIVAEKEYSNGSTSLENIYSYFDELVTAHSDYCSKVDIVSELGMTYPSYANGVSGDPTYLDTPAYKTYMYRFTASNPHVNTANNTKQKMLLVGATHGDEQASPFNLYLFAKRLCEDFLTDENLFKLRLAYDIYIIPCLNGYGMYHVQRANANGVDINRNYPIKKWAIANVGTTHYTGPSAGSEFETQLIMAVISNLNPAVFIDHHNYASNLAWQFYSEINAPEHLKLCYQSAVDCSYTFKKNYPQYFGANCDFVIGRTGAAPGTLAADTNGTTTRYAYEQGIPLAETVEISQCINYLNGSPSGVATNPFGSDTFAIAEYTLRNQLLRYSEWALKHT